MGVECANGKCQSWIDDELDAMGEAGAHIPRPGGCCEEDAKKQREAATMLRELRAVDRSVERIKLAESIVKEGARDEDEHDDDWAATDDDEDEDAFLRELKARRLRELKGAAANAAAEARRARYTEIKETALGETLRASSRVVAHVVLEGAEQCARIDEVCDDLAPAFPKTKFVRIRPSVDASVMKKIGVVALPAVLIFHRGRLAHASCALEEFGGADDFDEERVTRWLAQRDALPGHPLAGTEKIMDSNASSDENESDDEVFGMNKPCEQCGRTYPHKHIRALRPGESMHRRENNSDDDDDDDF